MYILIKEDLPIGNALVAAAHASLMCHLEHYNDLEYSEWVRKSFRKCICKVNDKEFEKAKEIPDNMVVTESSLDGQEVAIVLKPRKEWPKNVQYYRLWK